ncbi:hypothetical protein KM043_000633 [Ampulex compressa]|nr:hypothetical protein KM043_000633 [Ampulex compressa]
MEDLDIFSTDKKFEKILLRCPSRRRTISQDTSMLRDLCISNQTIESGTDYVSKYVEQEEKEVLESAQLVCDPKEIGDRFDQVSKGTIGALQDFNDEDLNKIYRTYNFAYRPNANLTVVSMKDKIVSMIDTNAVVVIQGPTGCGKTTQVPQFILDSCYKKRAHCNIIVTQPRRIAAISIAKRVSQERNWPVGTLVGYQVGMINHTSRDTRLTYCTTGVLLHKLINTKNMLDYTHVILDEVHERDQDMDFLLLVIRKLLRTNSRTVKVVLMSATFEVEKFAKYYSLPLGNKLVPAPIVDIAKKSYYNTNIFYLCQIGTLGPLPEICKTEPKITIKMMEFCTRIVIVFDELDMQAHDANINAATGDYERHVTLIFLPGIHEIEEMHDLLCSPKYQNSKWDIVVLHSSITNEEQLRIFEKPPTGYRRIILSTNIAESSITVPDVKYVIDFCLTKQLITDLRTNLQCLELTWASKANCQQRAGRTGRVMDGRVYRLVPKNFYDNALPKVGHPEILRAPLENIVLKTKLLDMGEPRAILALSLDPPDLSNLESTILLLKESGALLNRPENMKHFDGELTDLGRIMANLPMDIRIAKLIMLGHVFSVLRDAIIIGASMVVKEMFCNPFQQKLLAYNVKRTWAGDSYSDCMAFLNVYKVWISEKANRRLRSDDAEKKWALRNFIQIRVLREVKAFVTEITNRLKKLGIIETFGPSKVIWSKEEVPFVLKVVIAGAFYPNYFVRRVQGGQTDARSGIKLLGGLDPGRTVYVQGWPVRQPGMLYAKLFQNAFQHCSASSLGKVKVSFDESTRVYIEFIKDDHADNEDARASKRISPSVYKAIKMRQCNVPITIPVLNEERAIEKARRLNLLHEVSVFGKKGPEENTNGVVNVRPRMPKLGVQSISLKITHIVDPNYFWIHIYDSETVTDMERIETLLASTRTESLETFRVPPQSGTLVLAPEKNDGSISYKRATIESCKRISEQSIVNVLFIDSGKKKEIRLSDLRKLDVHDELANIPASAIKCNLAHVRPSITRKLSEYWSQTAIDLFRRLIESSKLLVGEIFSIANSTIALDLICVTKSDDEINVNKYLIKNEFATWREEDYFSRYNHEQRKRHADLTAEQCEFYEEQQYDKSQPPSSYPDPPLPSECYSNLSLRGPYSPLEIELTHLIAVGSDKKVNVSGTSVNSVLLDTDPEGPHDPLLVAASISQSPFGDKLTLYNTTLMPNLPGLTSLLSLMFCPAIEMRRNAFGSRYVGALCGLGYHPATGTSIFPEHDMEIMFDVEITMDDLQEINKLRHWISMGMHVNDQADNDATMEETMICQNRIKIVFLKLFNKSRKVQKCEKINNFGRWNLYDKTLLLQPGKAFIMRNNVYNLHSALELEEKNDELEEMTEHLKELRILSTEDGRKAPNIDVRCKLCDVEISDIPNLRRHLYSLMHRQGEKRLGKI